MVSICCVYTFTERFFPSKSTNWHFLLALKEQGSQGRNERLGTVLCPPLAHCESQHRNSAPNAAAGVWVEGKARWEWGHQHSRRTLPLELWGSSRESHLGWRDLKSHPFPGNEGPLQCQVWWFHVHLSLFLSFSALNAFSAVR